MVSRSREQKLPRPADKRCVWMLLTRRFACHICHGDGFARGESSAHKIAGSTVALINPLPGRAVITAGRGQSVLSMTRLVRLAGLHEARLMR